MIDLEKHIEHEEDIVRVDDVVHVIRVSENETSTNNSAKKIVTNNAYEILKETEAATVTNLERHNEEDDTMVNAPERQNDNDFNHRASEE
ncbi:hypothetical protein A2U01_0043629, partial [Trifolium medium]|nr:hypothetical protein [Trifolium medium]